MPVSFINLCGQKLVFLYLRGLSKKVTDAFLCLSSRDVLIEFLSKCGFQSSSAVKTIRVSDSVWHFLY